VNAPVVVTGVGTIGAAGEGLGALRSALRVGELPTREVDRSAGFHREHSVRTAGLVRDDAYGSWLLPAQARRMSPPSRMAVAAARMAIHSAALSEEDVRGEDTAIVLGTAFGCTTFTAKLLQQIVELGPEAISPFLFMETVASAHAGQIALALGARGSNWTLTQREASGSFALARGRDLVASGKARIVIAGVVDEMGPLLHAVLDRFRALSPDARGRAYDARRSGILASEGSTILVLEEERAARARGAPVLARIRAAVRANDPSASASDWGREGARLGEELRSRLGEADLDVAAIDAVVSGASGSPSGDRAEAEALHACFQGELPPILVPKATTGEFGGGWLAAAFLALEGGRIAAPADFEVDPELAIVPSSSSSSTRGAPRTLLLSSLASSGPAAWLVLERPEA
jgi:3-oxoacyl-[acyl-carrier-protein] synthase II